MKRAAIDTNVVVAGLLTWHEHHERALAVLLATRAAAGGLILPLPVLVESYAVMTRLPPPHRLAPHDTHRLLRSAFRDHTQIAALSGSNAWGFLDELPLARVSGGATYDAHILACAKVGGAERLVTFNLKHYQSLELGGLQLVTP